MGPLDCLDWRDTYQHISHSPNDVCPHSSHKRRQFCKTYMAMDILESTDNLTEIWFICARIFFNTLRPSDTYKLSKLGHH